LLPSRRPSFLFFALSLAAALVCWRLGIWQLHRLGQREARNRATREARALPPISLDNPAETKARAPGPPTDRRIRVTGRYDHAGDLVLREQSVEGVPAVKVVTPLRPLVGESAVLVIRGYVPSPDAMTVQLDSLQEPGIHVIQGYAVPVDSYPDRGNPVERNGVLSLRRLDLSLLRQRFPFPLRSFAIAQLPDSSLPALPRRVTPGPLDNGPHLSYAIQWFSFGVIALVGGAIVAFGKGGRMGRREDQAAGG
jgi:surfeit locus 1 family protein